MLAKIFMMVSLCGISILSAGKATPYSPDYQRCLDRSDGVTVSMRQCIADELHLQDLRLNRYYKRVMSRLTGEQKGRLREAQRLWIRYRDANCGFYGGLTGGSMDIILAGDCTLEMTANRATELRNMMDML
jgi:uncharacterized protein YecT (DUF1311 family)